MPGIGIVTNPNSRKNRRFPQRMHRLGYILGQDDHYQLTRSIDDIQTVATEFKENKIDILALNGGDGTNHVTLTHFINVYGEEPLPKIAFLRGGTMNNICESLGIFGTPQSLLANLVEKHYTNQPFEETECDMLKIDDGKAVRYGFIFGNGIVSNFLELYYATGHPSPVTAARLVSQAIAGLPFGGKLIKEIIRPFKARISYHNDVNLPEQIDWPTDDYTAIIAATVNQIGLHFRPFIRAEEQPHAFHMLSIQGSPLTTIANLPRIRAGLAADPDAFKSIVATNVTLQADQPIYYTIDGELHQGTTELKISTGPRLRCIIK